MAAYTTRKIATINLGYLVAASVFALGSAYFALNRGSQWETGWWRVVLAGVVAVVIAVFPLVWAFLPDKHPVRRAVARHGNAETIASVLDDEMKSPQSIQGPFHFTGTYLVYDPGYALDVIPYHLIVSAEVVLDSSGISNGGPKVVLMTGDGKTYAWFSTWIGGRFDPDQVVAQIRSAARLQGPGLR